jgi:hypothetical protein
MSCRWEKVVESEAWLRMSVEGVCLGTAGEMEVNDEKEVQPSCEYRGALHCCVCGMCMDL